ncbi:hypothetical protein AN189_12930 [Loktanella sp. 3ANDIMAR09]|uniref:hypothetical protein n=1 Tax=Loktanella sp. 3ANDIMAR09 TaxID=1225657 RepID=UPI0006F5692E|nr:hypothetical protein [Loktanella sp. 3ANDIMAR09]KQI67977.1 hypothetical protein AN189_12930 [Loktanella sp. 3ANDIMAR09]
MAQTSPQFADFDRHPHRQPDDWIVDDIKSALNRCNSVAEVNATARHFAKDVRDLELSPKETDRTMAIQIRNLAAYRRKMISEGGR